MREEAVDSRALALFERLTETPQQRDALLADEPPAVIAAVLTLIDAAPRARIAFPTEEDEAADRTMPPLPERVGAYRLEERLGEGGMGMVFAAERCDGLFEHRVAVKLIHPERVSQRALDRFAAERRILARLDHSGIARLIDGGVTAEGWPYIIMERADGEPLDVAAARLPIAARVALVAQVADAVSAAHSALIAHGDIKPGNILVDRSGRVRLLDFGVARLIHDPADAGPRPHTNGFASPALIEGEAPAATDDIYALGVLLRAAASAGLEGAHELRPADADLAAIADKAAARDPERRYRSADAFAADLARWREMKPIEARPPSWRYSLGLLLRRRRRALLTALAAVIALAIATGVAISGWQQARERQTAVAARTGDLRQLARYQFLVLNNRLEHQPHSTALRRDLVREAQQMLASAVAAPDASPALRRDAAEGYRLLALIEGAPGRPSLGDSAAAERSLARGAALVEEDASPAGRTILARILLDQAQLAGGSGRVDEALALLKRAETLVPPDQAALADEVKLLRADTLIWNGDYRAARRLADSLAPHFAAAPRSHDHVLRRDRFRERLAEATYYEGDTRAALDHYRRAATDLAAARRRWPGDPVLDWAQARQAWNVGTTLIELGRPADARAWLADAADAMAAKVANDPEDAIAARRLRSFQLSLAQADALLGRFPQAIASLEANIAARRRWMQAAPASSERTRDLAIAVAALGDVHAQAGDTAAACRRYGEVKAIHRQLAAERRLSRLDADYFGALVTKSATRLRCPGFA